MRALFGLALLAIAVGVHSQDEPFSSGDSSGSSQNTPAFAQANLRVMVVGADPEQGLIDGALFDSADTFLKQPRDKVTVPVDANGSATLDFGQQATGPTAVVIIYDKNSNGELDTGFLGIPKEKVGFSNNARGRFGPASWEDSQFELTEDLQIEIRLISAKDD